MKKYIHFLYLVILILFTFNTDVSAWKIIINSEWTTINIKSKDITREDIFNYLWDYFGKWIPKTYKYIDLNFKGIDKDSYLYESLQKLVYLDIIENISSSIWKNKKLSKYNFLRLVEKAFWENLINKSKINKLKNINTNKKDLKTINTFLNKELIDFKEHGNSYNIIQKKAVFVDVYNTIINNHYDKDNLNEVKLIESAIEWVTKWLDDKHTVYFPAIESKNFYESLNGEYEWIWSYVDMVKPWEVKIVSPITGSPSMKAWLKWWDIIIKVDKKEIKKENSLQEVITWIKWLAWTKVNLTIKRWTIIFDVDVTREKITIKDVEYKLLDDNTFYIEIKSFWDSVWKNFKEALNELKSKKNIKKIIIDLRNNGWWYLWEVTDMLSYFIKKWEPTAIVKYKDVNKIFYSIWYDLIDFSKYNIVLLENSWTASASEIMIWTIKDYYNDAKIIWENSYWKWSVQTIKSYNDWSSLKYTIAKWFTGKTEKWIDWIWIKPDIEIEFDVEKYKKDNIDNQLEEAKNIWINF